MTTETEAHNQRLIAAMTAAAETIETCIDVLDNNESSTARGSLYHALKMDAYEDRYGRGTTGVRVAAELRALIAEVER